MAEFPAFEDAEIYTTSTGRTLTAQAATAALNQTNGLSVLRSLSRRADFGLPKHMPGDYVELELDGDEANPEAVHSSLIIPRELITIRTRIEFDGIIRTTGQNAADTWRIRVRFGGLAGDIVLDTGTWDLEADTSLLFKGVIHLEYNTGTPASSTLTYTTQWDNILAAPSLTNIAHDYEVAVDLSGNDDFTLDITSLCSSTNTGNTVVVKRFEAKIFAPSTTLLAE